MSISDQLLDHVNTLVKQSSNQIKKYTYEILIKDVNVKLKQWLCVLPFVFGLLAFLSLHWAYRMELAKAVNSCIASNRFLVSRPKMKR